MPAGEHIRYHLKRIETGAVDQRGVRPRKARVLAEAIAHWMGERELGAVNLAELGFEPMDRQEASLFFSLVTYRYGRGSILITTNKSIRHWLELLAGDEVLSTAILDRLLHKATRPQHQGKELPTQRSRTRPVANRRLTSTRHPQLYLSPYPARVCVA